MVLHMVNVTSRTLPYKYCLWENAISRLILVFSIALRLALLCQHWDLLCLADVFHFLSLLQQCLKFVLCVFQSGPVGAAGHDRNRTVLCVELEDINSLPSSWVCTCSSHSDMFGFFTLEIVIDRAVEDCVQAKKGKREWFYNLIKYTSFHFSTPTVTSFFIFFVNHLINSSLFHISCKLWSN